MITDQELEAIQARASFYANVGEPTRDIHRLVVEVRRLNIQLASEVVEVESLNVLLKNWQMKLSDALDEPAALRNQLAVAEECIQEFRKILADGTHPDYMATRIRAALARIRGDK